MISKFGCSPRPSMPFVYFETIIWALCALVGTLSGDDAKLRPALPRPSSSPDEARIFRSLAKPTSVEFIDLPLEDCLTFLKEYQNVKIRVDNAALAKAKIRLDSPVMLKLDGAAFRGTLDLLLEPLGLDSYVGGPELIVTTRAATTDAVRSRLAKILEHEIQIIDHLCDLTEVQRQKLTLGGRGDVEQLFAGVEERRTKLPRIKNDVKTFNEVLDEIAQLKQKFESGPFGHGALLRKAVEKTLTTEQAVKYEPIREVLQGGGLVETIERGQDVFLAVVLIGDGFTDEILPQLKRLPTLGFLRLIDTKVSGAGIAKLQQALPSLKIEK